MSAPTTEAAARPGFARRHRSTVLIGGALVAAVVIAVVLGNGTETSIPLDPDNPGPEGARALAQVLGDNGVEVDVARSADELESLPAGSDTTVVVVLPENLGETTAQRLLDHTSGARVVVVGAGPAVTDLLDVADPPSHVSVQDGRRAECTDPLFEGLTIEVDSSFAYLDGECFPGTPADPGALVSDPRSGLTLLGADQVLTNDQILRADNAAVALRLLGQDDRLVWYLPSLNDLLAGDGVSLQSLLPTWIRPALWVAALAMLTVIWWRFRRLGALAVEPLPVVVRAVETTRSLGRLYRRAGDRGHAAESLRRAARTRCAERLRLGTVPPEVLVREVARRTGRDQSRVADLLMPQAPGPGTGPATDRDLITLANDLAELDREVRRP